MWLHVICIKFDKIHIQDMRLGIYKKSYLYKSGKRREIHWKTTSLFCITYAVLEVISDPTQLVDNSTTLVVSRTIMMSIYPFFLSRDFRSYRAALFDGIEEGGIRAPVYSSREIHEQGNDQAMDSLHDRVSILKRVCTLYFLYLRTFQHFYTLMHSEDLSF